MSAQRTETALQCAVCDEVFPAHVEHPCPYDGPGHANMHRELARRLQDAEARIELLMLEVRALRRGEGGLP